MGPIWVLSGNNWAGIWAPNGPIVGPSNLHPGYRWAPDRQPIWGPRGTQMDPTNGPAICTRVTNCWCHLPHKIQGSIYWLHMGPSGFYRGPYNNDNNNKNVTYKALTKKVSKRYGLHMGQMGSIFTQLNSVVYHPISKVLRYNFLWFMKS